VFECRLVLRPCKAVLLSQTLYTMRNPIRRNKNIGKTQGGRVMDGKAFEKWSRSCFNHNCYSIISDNSTGISLYTDNPSKDYFHPCSHDDYLSVLKRLPEEDYEYLKGIILPRPNKFDKKYGIEAKRRYSCIIMVPFHKSLTYTWPDKPEEYIFKHNDPWCKNWKNQGNEWSLTFTLPELRNYYMYHVFLHELGHINQPAYHSLRRREEFAENFAFEKAKYLGELHV